MHPCDFLGSSFNDSTRYKQGLSPKQEQLPLAEVSLSWLFPALKGSSGGEHRESLQRLIKKVGEGEKEMGHKRNEPGIYAGSDSIRGRLNCSALDKLDNDLSDGEGKRRRKRESPNVLNIQLAVFIDRFLPSIEQKRRQICKCSLFL